MHLAWVNEIHIEYVTLGQPPSNIKKYINDTKILILE